MVDGLTFKKGEYNGYNNMRTTDQSLISGKLTINKETIESYYIEYELTTEENGLLKGQFKGQVIVL